MTRRNWSGRRAQRARTQIIARDHGICGLCQHPGANTLGHIIAAEIRPDLEWVPSNWQAQHGPKAGRPGGCQVLGCTCPGNYGLGTRTPTPTPTRSW